jgi:predicted  nucleic acid-binding Zn-ribbon protein
MSSLEDLEKARDAASSELTQIAMDEAAIDKELESFNKTLEARRRSIIERRATAATKMKGASTAIEKVDGLVDVEVRRALSEREVDERKAAAVLRDSERDLRQLQYERKRIGQQKGVSRDDFKEVDSAISHAETRAEDARRELDDAQKDVAAAKVLYRDAMADIARDLETKPAAVKT